MPLFSDKHSLEDGSLSGLVVDSCALDSAVVRFPSSNVAGRLVLSPRPFIGTSGYERAGHVPETGCGSDPGLIATEPQGGRTFAHSATDDQSSRCPLLAASSPLVDLATSVCK